MPPQYLQHYLNANPWDQAGTKTVLSTVAATLVIDNGTISLLSGDSVLASAPVPDVTASVKGLAGLVAGVQLDFGSGKWLVDFGSAYRRSQRKSTLKTLVGMFNVAGGFKTVSMGKRYRDEFVARFIELGGRSAG